MIGMWQFWWNTFGHLSQHISSPPSRHTAHQSSFGSSFWLFLSAKKIIDTVKFLVDVNGPNQVAVPSTGAETSVELCTCGDVVLPRWPSGNTWTPFESNFAMVAIRSLTDSAHTLSSDSPISFEFWKFYLRVWLEHLRLWVEVGWKIRFIHTSLVLGLGVFGLVDVTVEGTPVPFALGLLVCRSVVGDFRLILNEFSSVRPFVQNCMESGDWDDWILPEPNHIVKRMNELENRLSHRR